jgi:uncharacterized OB-fold protein
MDLARNWRLKGQRYRLEGAVCADCGAKFFPPRQVCAECRSQNLQPYAFSGRGELFSFTTLYQAPLGYEGGVPYAVGMVKLDEGPMVEAQLTDVSPDDLKVGQRVEMVTRKLREFGPEGLIVYGYKFRPVANGH